MFSRVGKTTVAQYLVFSKERASPFKLNTEENDDFGEDFLEEKRPTDIEGELKKI